MLFLKSVKITILRFVCWSRWVYPSPILVGVPAHTLRPWVYVVQILLNSPGKTYVKFWKHRKITFLKNGHSLDFYLFYMFQNIKPSPVFNRFTLSVHFGIQFSACFKFFKVCCQKMPKWTLLNSTEKEITTRLKGEDNSNRNIARTIGRSRTIVDNFIKGNKKKLEGQKNFLSAKNEVF